jgi:hypothetical protein
MTVTAPWYRKLSFSKIRDMYVMLMKYFSNLILIKSKRNDRNMEQRERGIKKEIVLKEHGGSEKAPLK